MAKRAKLTLTASQEPIEETVESPPSKEELKPQMSQKKTARKCPMHSKKKVHPAFWVAAISLISAGTYLFLKRKI